MQGLEPEQVLERGLERVLVVVVWVEQYQRCEGAVGIRLSHQTTAIASGRCNPSAHGYLTGGI